jgi:hypothetical protein
VKTYVIKRDQRFGVPALAAATLVDPTEVFGVDRELSGHHRPRTLTNWEDWSSFEYANAADHSRRNSVNSTVEIRGQFILSSEEEYTVSLEFFARAGGWG